MADRLTGDPGAAELRATVIIPTFNRQALLREALEALTVQTLPPAQFEVVVVDNLSSDGTREMMQALVGKMPFHLVYHVMPSNRGPARSRNTAVRQFARAPILAFIDDDCRPHPAWLEHSLAPFDDPAVALVSGRVLFKPEQRMQRGFFTRDGHQVLAEHPTYTWSNSCYRRSVFEALGGSDESLCLSGFRESVVDCGDTDLAWRLKEAGHRNVFVPESITYHEIQQITPRAWLCEPLRLFVVNELVRRHPDLRNALLYKGLFFNGPNVLVYVAIVGMALAIAAGPWFSLLIVPYLVWCVRLLRPIISWSSAPKLVPQTLLLGARQAMCCVAMIYGTFKFRSLVL